MLVYVISRCERNEGGSVIAVRSSRELADKFVESNPLDLNVGDVDYYEIEEMEVDG